MLRKRLPTSDDMLRMLDCQEINLWEEIPEEEPLLKLKIRHKIKRKVKPKLKETVEVKQEVKKEEPKTEISRKKVEIPQELIDKKTFTRKDFEESLEISTRTANRLLNKLIKEGKIKRIGSANSPSCYYEKYIQDK